jgi:hypothetical protein
VRVGVSDICLCQQNTTFAQKVFQNPQVNREDGGVSTVAVISSCSKREPGYVPLYHGNFQGSTIKDLRYTPALPIGSRTDYDGGGGDNTTQAQ